MGFPSKPLCNLKRFFFFSFFIQNIICYFTKEQISIREGNLPEIKKNSNKTVRFKQRWMLVEYKRGEIFGVIIKGKKRM